MNFEQFKNKIISEFPHGLCFRGNYFIDFYNVPEVDTVFKRFNGAYYENNRFAFSIRGFKNDDSSPEKIQVELSVCSADREFRKSFRKKTANPEKIADYIIAFIKKVQSEVKTSTSGR